MADEEKNQADEQPEGTEAAEPAEPEAPPAEEPAAEAAPAPAPPPADGSEEEALTPKQARKRARSIASGPAKPPRSGDERAVERAERRRANAARRRAHRGAEREARAGSGEGTAPAERAPGSRKVRQGTVVSAKPDKTITVEIEIARRHPVYEKVVRRSATLHAHDERNDANEGDVVRVVEARPLSKTKRWRLVEILERAR